MKNKINLTFIIMFILIILLGNYTLVREQKDISYIENRNLQKFEHFTIKSFFEGTFQNNLEKAISDQFIGSERIKTLMNEILDFSKHLNIKNKVCENNYFNLGEHYYSFDCNEVIVEKGVELTENNNKQILSQIEIYNDLNNYTDMYYYYIQTSGVFDFKNNKHTIDIEEMLKNNLEGNYHLESLKFNNYDEYINYFYRTDHHWNNHGSYQGYQDIAKMMNFENIIKPSEEIVFEDLNFYGSFARNIRNFDYEQKFTVYKFELNNYNVTIDGKKDNYGRQQDYFNKIYDRNNKYVNHYGEFYGYDYGEIIYDFNQPQKENLLIVASSYSNPINSLLASNFNKTYIIDLRHYRNYTGYDFDIKEYIKKNNIKKTLIIMDYGYLISENNNLEV